MDKRRDCETELNNEEDNNECEFDNTVNSKDIDDLVNTALRGMTASKAPIAGRSFSTLNDRLMSAGNITTNLSSNNTLVLQNLRKQNKIEKAQEKSSLYDSNFFISPPLIAPKVDKSISLGKGWFDFKPIDLDENLKRDIKIIQMRNYLDPKRFYKNPDKIQNVVHVGTVIEGPSEYKSSRLNRKDRKQSIVDEILHDRAITSYSKRTYLSIQAEKSSKKKTFKNKKKSDGGDKKRKRINELF